MINKQDIQPKIVWGMQELLDHTYNWKGLVVADVETYGKDPLDGKLLGVALCSIQEPSKPVYVVLQWYDFKVSTWHVVENHSNLTGYLSARLRGWNLIGHNYSYDKTWCDHHFACVDDQTKWHACTRLMWHMASAPAGPRPYGLKDAQVEVLGWDKRGDSELEEQVSARGGTLKEGGHFLADVEVLGKYACLDAASTALLYNCLSPFFEKHEYWWMLEKMVEYSWLLEQNTKAGIRVDVPKLEAVIETLQNTKGAYSARFIELANQHIQKLERMWREDRAAKYTQSDARERFLNTWEMQKKFNLSSDKDKRELFYQALSLPVVMETKGKKPSTGQDAVVAAVRESGRQGQLAEIMEAYEQSESSETLLNSFAKPWLNVLRYGRLHPRFNPCGTVSYRLSGFKPYLLNAPFEETELMSCLQCDEGWEGLHADFSSIEPCVTAHYSQDSSLLKVFRDGLGDVYLSLAKTLLPSDERLRTVYNPEVPIESFVKETLKQQRKVAKIIQLAVQYGGKSWTVSKNLSIAGYPTSRQEAQVLVDAYWQHFGAVRRMNEALFRRYEKQGYLTNVCGRILRVPNPRYKDLPNRFIQSSAHDLLSLWVLSIASKVRGRKMRAKPVILDCHDSTSWQAPKEEIQDLESIFKEALQELNEDVKMTVPVKMEMKRFTTLAGLKGEE